LACPDGGSTIKIGGKVSQFRIERVPTFKSKSEKKWCVNRNKVGDTRESADKSSLGCGKKKRNKLKKADLHWGGKLNAKEGNGYSHASR